MHNDQDSTVVPFGEPAESQTPRVLAKWHWVADKLGFDTNSPYPEALGIARRNLLEAYRQAPRYCDHVRMIAFEMLRRGGQYESLYFDHALKGLTVTHLNNLLTSLIAGDVPDWNYLATLAKTCPDNTIRCQADAISCAGKFYLLTKKQYPEKLELEIARSWLMVSAATPTARLEVLCSETTRLRSLASPSELYLASQVLRPTIPGQPFVDDFLRLLREHGSTAQTRQFPAPSPSFAPAQSFGKKKQTTNHTSRLLVVLGCIIAVAFTRHLIHESTRPLIGSSSLDYQPRKSIPSPTPVSPSAALFSSIDSNPDKVEAFDRLVTLGSEPSLKRLRSERWRRWFYREQVLVRNFVRDNPSFDGEHVELIDDDSWKAQTDEARRELVLAWTSNDAQKLLLTGSWNAEFWASDVHLLTDDEIAILREGDPGKTEKLDRMLYPDPDEFAVARKIRFQTWEKAAADEAEQPIIRNQR